MTTKKNNKRKTKVKKPLTAEQIQKREELQFGRKIRGIFTNMGFEYVPTREQHFYLGGRDIEIDAIFICKNIWLICEDNVKDTVNKNTHIRDHMRCKNEAFGIISNNKEAFCSHLVSNVPNKEHILKSFDTSRIKMFCLYISKYDIPLNEGDGELFENCIFVQPKTLEYFHWISKCIKHSAKNELFKFLGLCNKDIGEISTSSESANITAPIIYPKEFTGLKNGVRIVSFMMSAQDLLDTAYVLRKDNWIDSMWLYQRLIKPVKIKKMRSFIAENGAAFFNNIIIALPDQVVFKDISGHYKNINQIDNLEGNCELVIPKEMNSICVIDGQHRIFAHYESGGDSAQERIISGLRKKLHLLVTGLVFPEKMPYEERIQFQSKIFHDINSTTDRVPESILLQIHRIKNPIEDDSLAQLVVEKLNKEGIFKNLFQLSSLEKGKIKTASIVKFALRYLVSVTNLDNKKSLISYWDGDKEALKKGNDVAINQYAEFCAKTLRTFFGALRKNYESLWSINSDSKLLSVITLNGFIIAFSRQLSVNGIKSFEYYDQLFKNTPIDFSKENFIYTSSQYRKFSSELLANVFGFSIDEVNKL